MYHCLLNIYVIGLAEAAVDVLKQVPPLPQFGHTFLNRLSLDTSGPKPVDLVIFDDSIHQTPAEIRKEAGPQALCAICTNHAEELGEADLQVLDFIWPKPLTASLLRFYFNQFQKQIKVRKDFALCRNYLDTTINVLPDMIWYKDKKGAHIKVNDAFCHVVGKPREDIQGRGHYYIWGLTKEQYEKGEYVCMETEEEIMRTEKSGIFDEQVLGTDGLHHLKTYKAPLFDETHTLIGTVGIARDVTREYEYQQQILHMAHTDALTGLPNRRYFYQYAEENRQNRPITALYIDIDSFKRFNDTLGHHAGDIAITSVAQALKEDFADAFTARLGGDEFFTIFFCLCDMNNLKKRLESIQQKISHTFPSITLSLSAGIAYTENPEVSLDDLMRNSDKALYQAKGLGKKCYCVFNENYKKL